MLTVKKLRQLILHNTDANDETCADIRKLCKQCHNLISIDLSGNPGITEKGMKELSKAVDENRTISRMSVDNSTEDLQHKMKRNLEISLVLDRILSSLPYYRLAIGDDSRNRRKLDNWVSRMPKEDPPIKPSARFNVGHHEIQGQRDAMEDAMLIMGQFRNSPNEDLFAVFDGHGGEEVAHYLTRALPVVLEQCLAQYPDKVEKAIQKTYETIDKEAKVRFKNVGSTAVVAYLTHNKIYVSNAGDSRAILSRDGAAIALSEDHKAEDKQEKARIKSEGGTVDNDRVEGTLAVTRAFGDGSVGNYVRADPYISVTRFEEGDEFLVLCCDGVTDVMSDTRICEVVRKSIQNSAVTDPNRWARDIVAMSVKRETSDNVSVLCINLNDRKVASLSMTSAANKKRKKSFSFTEASSSPALKRRNGETPLSPTTGRKTKIKLKSGVVTLKSSNSMNKTSS